LGRSYPDDSLLPGDTLFFQVFSKPLPRAQSQGQVMDLRTDVLSPSVPFRRGVRSANERSSNLSKSYADDTKLHQRRPRDFNRLVDQLASLGYPRDQAAECLFLTAFRADCAAQLLPDRNIRESIEFADLQGRPVQLDRLAPQPEPRWEGPRRPTWPPQRENPQGPRREARRPHRGRPRVGLRPRPPAARDLGESPREELFFEQADGNWDPLAQILL
jgi:hypothetical protein